MLLALLGAMGLMATFAYYVLLALTRTSSLDFLPLSGFATVAGYRSFQERSLPLPTFTEFEGPRCFTAGMPTQGLAAGSQCRLPVRLVGPSGPLSCSTWTLEICNVVALTAEIYRNEAFQTAFQSYINNPCRYVEDYQSLRSQLDPAAVSSVWAGRNARVIDLDFQCASLDGDQPVVSSAKGLWRRLRPHLLLENAPGEAVPFFEVRIKPPEE